MSRRDSKTRILTEAERRTEERANTLEALRRSEWKIYGPGGAAEMLGLKPTTLMARVNKMGLKKQN